MPSEKNLDSVFTDTADAIRSKLGTTELIQPINFADEIDKITGSQKKEVVLNVITNGIYTPAAGEVYSQAIVNTPEPKQEIELIATANTIYTPEEGKVYNKVTVNVPAGKDPVLNELLIDGSSSGDPYNKTFTASDYSADGFSRVVTRLDKPKQEQTKTVNLNLFSGDQSVLPDTGLVMNKVVITKPTTLRPYNIKKDVNIAGVIGTLEATTQCNLQSEKSVNPQRSRQTITPDPGFDGLASVIVGPVSSSIDSNIKPENIKSGVNILGVNGTAGVVNYAFESISFVRNSSDYTASTTNAIAYYVLVQYATGSYYPIFVPVGFKSEINITDSFQVYFSGKVNSLYAKPKLAKDFPNFIINRVYALREV